MASDLERGYIAAVSRGFDEWQGAGDWRAKPWFLEPNRLLDQWGYALELRVTAADALANVYTPEACRAIRAEPETGFGQVISLFTAAWPGMVTPLLDLGLALDAVGGISGDERLRKRLLKRAEFAGAAFEIKVWANLVRGRYGVARVPERQQPTADLHVEVGPDAYALEVKLARRSEADRDDDRLGERIRGVIPHVRGLALTAVGNAELARRALDIENRRQVRAQFDEIVAAFARAGEDAKSSGRQGSYEAAPFGVVVATAGPEHGSVSANVLPDLPGRKKAARVARLVRDAVAQLDGTRRGLVVVGVFRAADPGLVEEALLANGSAPIDYRRCRGVILVDSMKLQKPERIIPLAYPLSTSRFVKVTKPELTLARVVGADHRRFAELISRAPPGLGDFALDTERRRVTSMCMGQAKYQANSTITFRVAGGPRLVTNHER